MTLTRPTLFLVSFLAVALLIPTRVSSQETDSVLSPIKLDIKTALDQKEKLKLAKAGLKAYLKQSDWAEVVNLSEDYSVWLSQLRRKLKGNIIMIQMDIELRTPATLDKGKFIDKRHIVDTLDLGEAAKLSTVEEREMFRIVQKQLAKREKPKSLAAAVVGGVAGIALPGIGALIQNGLKHLGSELENQYTADQAVEGMVIGALLVMKLREMIDNVQKNK